MQSYDGFMNIPKFPSLKKLSLHSPLPLIINNFQFHNLSQCDGRKVPLPKRLASLGPTKISKYVETTCCLSSFSISVPPLTWPRVATVSGGAPSFHRGDI